MRVFWLSPIVWWGLTAIVIPVLIHMLTRQKSRRVPFPTLRFLRASRLAAFRRRSIHDWPLLIVRIATLVAATAALAGPVVVSSERQQQWARRVARAVVVAPGATGGGAQQDSLAAEERRDSFVNAVFRPADHLADGLRDAATWLERQPPAAREIVIVGDLREGRIAEPDVAMVSANIGLRFLPIPGEVATPNVSIPIASANLSGLANTTLLEDRTRTAYSRAPRQARFAEALIAVRAAPAELPFASAARDAVLAQGVRLDRTASRRLLIVFDGGDVNDLQLRQPPITPWMRDALAALGGMRGGERQQELVVFAQRRATDASVVHVIDRIAHAAFAEDLNALEPRRIGAATLAAWSRPPGALQQVPVSDEGDRRWFWAAALLLMVMESIMRRSQTVAAPAATIDEERVA